MDDRVDAGMAPAARRGAAATAARAERPAGGGRVSPGRCCSTSHAKRASAVAGPGWRSPPRSSAQSASRSGCRSAGSTPRSPSRRCAGLGVPAEARGRTVPGGERRDLPCPASSRSAATVAPDPGHRGVTSAWTARSPVADHRVPRSTKNQVALRVISCSSAVGGRAKEAYHECMFLVPAYRGRRYRFWLMCDDEDDDQLVRPFVTLALCALFAVAAARPFPQPRARPAVRRASRSGGPRRRRRHSVARRGGGACC